MKKYKPVSFWKPMKIKPTKIKLNSKSNPLFSFKPIRPIKLVNSINLKSQFNFISPVNLKKYPARTKSEWKLIDKKPFGDRDRDKVPNWFDCKPLNRKKRGEVEFAGGNSFKFTDRPPPKFMEDLKNMKIENEEQFRGIENQAKRFAVDIVDNMEGMTRQWKRYGEVVFIKGEGTEQEKQFKYANPIFEAPMKIARDKGYEILDAHPSYQKNKKGVVRLSQKLILKNPLDFETLTELNQQPDITVNFNKQENRTIIKIAQKGKSQKDMENELIKLMNILPTLKKENLTESEMNMFLKPKTVGVMEEEMGGMPEKTEGFFSKFRMDKGGTLGRRKRKINEKNIDPKVKDILKRMVIEEDKKIKRGSKITTLLLKKAQSKKIYEPAEDFQLIPSIPSSEESRRALVMIKSEKQIKDILERERLADISGLKAEKEKVKKEKEEMLIKMTPLVDTFLTKGKVVSREEQLDDQDKYIEQEMPGSEARMKKIYGAYHMDAYEPGEEIIRFTGVDKGIIAGESVTSPKAVPKKTKDIEKKYPEFIKYPEEFHEKVVKETVKDLKETFPEEASMAQDLPAFSSEKIEEDIRTPIEFPVSKTEEYETYEKLGAEDLLRDYKSEEERPEKESEKSTEEN